MDEKKIIAKLAAIVANQQKIIMKLAQLPPDSLPTSSVNVGGGHPAQLGEEPPPNKLDPNKVSKDPAAVFYSAMSDAQKAVLAQAPSVSGSDMNITFKPRQKTQGNYNSLFALLNKLVQSNQIQHNYRLNVA